MNKLSVNYLGLNLQNPIIVGSSGLTNDIHEIAELEARGAAAIVVKSLFEEEIISSTTDDLNKMRSSGFIYPETLEYFNLDDIDDPVSNYLKFLKDAKKEVKIPVIASINCITSEGWTDFTKRIEDTGVDAIELNVFPLSSDPRRTAEENENTYFEIAKKVTDVTKLPVSMKISYFHTGLANFIERLSRTKLKGLVLFNRFYNVDFNLDTFGYSNSHVFSTPAELSNSLRWIAIMSGRVNCDLAASTGVHNGYGAIKQLLAGAAAVQVVSTIYKNGKEQISFILQQLEQWMNRNGYNSIAEFKGNMSYDKTYNPAALERVQFMKYFNEK